MPLERSALDVGLLAGAALLGEELPQGLIAASKTGTDARTRAGLLSLTAATGKRAALAATTDALAADLFMRWF